MWNKPWTFKEGFLIGGGLIFAGLMLELSVGPVAWDAFAWPVKYQLPAISPRFERSYLLVYAKSFS